MIKCWVPEGEGECAFVISVDEPTLSSFKVKWGCGRGAVRELAKPNWVSGLSSPTSPFGTQLAAPCCTI
ncbi:MAG: hypothetical protein ACKESB_02245 [Candidatus Hodgkinia cicadicola]